MKTNEIKETSSQKANQQNKIKNKKQNKQTLKKPRQTSNVSKLEILQQQFIEAEKNYRQQINRNRSVETKASYLIFLYVGIISLLIADFNNFKLNTELTTVLCAIFIFITIFSMLISLIFLIKIFETKYIDIIDSEEINFKNFLNQTKECFYASLAAAYIEYFKNNEKSLNEKYKNLRIVMISIVISFLFGCLALIIKIL